jgi:hypothetical protein
VAAAGPWAARNLHPTTAVVLSLHDGRVMVLSARGVHTFTTPSSPATPLTAPPHPTVSSPSTVTPSGALLPPVRHPPPWPPPRRLRFLLRPLCLHLTLALAWQVSATEWSRPLDGCPVCALPLPLPLPPAASTPTGDGGGNPAVVLVGDDGGGWRLLDLASGRDAPLVFEDGVAPIENFKQPINNLLKTLIDLKPHLKFNRNPNGLQVPPPWC